MYRFDSTPADPAGFALMRKYLADLHIELERQVVFGRLIRTEADAIRFLERFLQVQRDSAAMALDYTQFLEGLLHQGRPEVLAAVDPDSLRHDDELMAWKAKNQALSGDLMTTATSLPQIFPGSTRVPELLHEFTDLVSALQKDKVRRIEAMRTNLGVADPVMDEATAREATGQFNRIRNWRIELETIDQQVTAFMKSPTSHQDSTALLQNLARFADLEAEMDGYTQPEFIQMKNWPANLSAAFFEEQKKLLQALFSLQQKYQTDGEAAD